eukprot:CAMPEP_0197188378 /NCGR_PEP_ID=MMETSP1423-20130617/17686_1 /TAXON_ID=476441 /ORGANISM="Pseudo-nitzschia heimii, Strain UNC1101" /LENGTH=560 /DNA_ID=CAMNT_0042640187 /DNA_START=109 /DNA_END=1791 /DNA_ORIENTATION=+
MMPFQGSYRPALFFVVLLAVVATSSVVSAFSTRTPSRLTPSVTSLKAATVESSTASSTSGTTTPKASDTKAEEVVRRYFDGVNQKDPRQLRSCFGASATIRDVCGLHSSVRTVPSELLVERCMEFVTAHPDCLVRFHHGPIQERETDRDGSWVVAHWYEVGHWSGASCGIEAPDPPRPMACEGQTRFRIVLHDDAPTIEEFVVTRTFTEWETAMIAERRRDAEEDAGNHYIFSTTAGDQSEAAGDDLLRSMVVTAERAARAAGKVIRDAQDSSFGRDLDGENDGDSVSTEQKANIKDIVTKYDREAQDVVERIIRSEFPLHSFLGEENVAAGGDASSQALADALDHGSDGNDGNGFVWIVDPIDGTANFASGLDLCGVTVAVVDKNSGEALVGVIYDPHRDEMFVAVHGRGAYCNRKRIGTSGMAAGSTPAALRDTIVNAGCPADPNAFAASLRGVGALNSRCRGLRVVACSALTLAWVASDRLGAHFGYDLSAWDLVAGALLVREAGGRVTGIDGSPYDVRTRSMLVSSPGSNTGESRVHNDVLGVLRDADAVSFERAS